VEWKPAAPLPLEKGRRYTRATLALGSQRGSVRHTRPAAPLRVGGADVRAYLERCAAGIERHRDYLTRLDAVLGDGDHGDNMAVGLQAIGELVGTYPPETSPGELLRAVGHRLATAVGGASGPLYGTALIEAGLVAGSEPALEWPLIGRMLEAAAAGLARRGRCRVGDKTILDTLRPAADAFVAADGPRDGLRNTLMAGWHGMRSTRPLVARRGLALRLGVRSAGHLDPGAVSCFILLAAIVPSRGNA
jgi:phosphoenolpyruvate---glycerone phosphotransferase subunit DhaL